MPYPINQRAHQFNSIQSVPVSFGLWDTALKFLSPGPRSDVTDHLVGVDGAKGMSCFIVRVRVRNLLFFFVLAAMIFAHEC